MKRFQSIRFTLITAFMSGLLLPIAAITLYGNFFTRGALSDQAIERSVHEVRLQAEQFVHSLEQAQGDALYLRNQRSLQKLRSLIRDDADTSEIQIWRDEATQDFLVMASVRPMYYRIRYIVSNGDEMIHVASDSTSVHSISSDELQNRSSAMYFQAAMQLDADQVYVSPFAVDTEDSNNSIPVIRYAQKLPNDDGIILLDVFVSWVLRNLTIVTSGEHWALIDQDGHYLLYPEAFEPEGAENDTSSMIIQPETVNFLETDNGFFETKNSVFVFKRIYPTASNPDQFWVLYRETPKSILFADVNDFYARSSIIVAGALLLALLLALFISQYFLQPILDLQQKAEIFGHEGILPPQPIRVPSNEIGTLSRVFYQMAHELEKKRHEQRLLIEQLINAQEEERKLVAYDLHDGMIQQMVGARFHLSGCQENCPVKHDEMYQGMTRSCTALTESIIEGRHIIEGLHPTVLDDLGLVEAIKEIAVSNANAAGWQLELDVYKLPKEPDKALSVTLFRIGQEALNNIRKHAKAQKVKITLTNSDGITLKIEDDGRGFDLTTRSGERRGMGIRTMKERASLVEGTCVIHSQPGQGTYIQVHVPYQEKEATT